MRGFERFTRLPAGDGWFDVYEVRSNLFAIHEPGHYEEPTSCLLLGEQRAALIDTGCGIGNLRGVVDALTDLPVLVVNTHTHIDHLGGNPQFDHIAMFDHARSRAVSERGVGREQRTTEILAPHLMTRPMPTSLARRGGCARRDSRIRARHRSVGPPAPVIPFRTVPDPDPT